MRAFAEIHERALQRKGEALQERLPQPLSPDALAATDDYEWLASMAMTVFAAGFRWRVVKAKWPGFEEAFVGFRPDVVASFDRAREVALAADRRVIRNPQKIRATIENARFVRDVAAEHGSFGRMLAAWPQGDVTGVWKLLKTRGARLGGLTGPRMLRHVGFDTFILTPDVVFGLQHSGALDASPTSAKGMRQASAAFAAWREETGLPLAQLSVILACSVDRPPAE